MKLFLDNPIFTPSFKIKHTDRLFFIGSCFADSISEYFTQRKFTILQNPFGVLYNPVSIADSLEHIARKCTYDTEDFYVHNEIYCSWYHHSNVSMSDAVDLKNKLDALNRSSFNFFKASNVAFITLGTAWAFFHKKNDTIVANNHRAPADLFDKKLLSLAEIKNALTRTIQSLKLLNPTIKIVLTVSPVRHSRQGLINNSRSKARLLEAAHALCEQENDCFYFPSYELLIDVLRDYRFYEKDLVHPNALATDYVWEYLCEYFIDKSDAQLIADFYKLYLATQHKLRQSSGVAARKFINEQIAIIETLQAENKYVNLEEEKAYFESL